MELFIRIHGIPTKLNQYSKMQIRSININGYNQRIFRYVNFIIPCTCIYIYKFYRKRSN